MDHTLVRYNHSFEKLTHLTLITKLIEQKGYPLCLLELPPDFELVIRGLILDKKKGNLLKVNRHGWIRKSSHGSKEIDFGEQSQIYQSVYIDLSDTDKYYAVDTAFAIPTATLYSQLVDLKDGTLSSFLPDYETIANDLLAMEDEAHQDASLKGQVASNLEQFILRDPEVVVGLERYIKHGKKLFILTNSEFDYTKLLLDYAINPFLKEHSNWQDLFHLVITGANKPRFFFKKQPYYHIIDGQAHLHEGRLTPGIYQGGNALQFTVDFGLNGDEVLYIGDHIYSDLLRLKKSSNWRTALVLEELEAEIVSYHKTEPAMREIHQLMKEKEILEKQLVDMVSLKIETGKTVDEEKLRQLRDRVHELDVYIGQLIAASQSLFNVRWGELMRAGNEESYLAYQTDRFACIYMACLGDLLKHSPRTYFRAIRRPLAHELALTQV